MKNNVIKRLQRAEYIMGDCELLIRNDKYYLNRVRNIYCEIEELRTELETHV